MKSSGKKWNNLILTEKFEHSLNIAYLFCNFCQFIFRSRFLHFFFPAARAHFRAHFFLEKMYRT